MSILVLKNDIYSQDNIKKAIYVYRDYATISVTNNKTSTDLEFKNCKYDLDLTKKEFENYLIALENS